MQAIRKTIADDKRLKEDVQKLEGGDTPQSIVPDKKTMLRKDKGTSRRRRLPTFDTLDELKEKMLSADDVHALNQQAADTKQALKDLIEANKNVNRAVRSESLTVENMVAVFDSSLTRHLQMVPEQINDELVIVKVYYFGVAENIIKNGFWMNGEHYVFFSASAGQIRTKKFVAIRESAYLRCYNALSCGLSVEEMNAKGGMNINKYLAYLALCNSATTPWDDFDITKAIVVDDFETNVHGLVDFIDEKDFSITRREQDVPITHTDGCGMILPQVSRINFMVRAPWIKGLLTSFPFDKFIKEANAKHPGRNHGLIKDIYGLEHDVLAEGIEIIFTKSQFKLWRLYDSWKDYQTRFIECGCTAGKCNEEPKKIDDAKFNYQMLQTLTDLSDDELSELCHKTNQKLRMMTSDRKTMLQVFGATKDESRMTPFQKCLAYYPELLQDVYCREKMRDLKNSIELQAVAGRLEIDGKYLFLIPDMYAACEHWFLGIETPRGLLADGNVFCRVYKNEPEMDVLRSPHLYREHCVRRNDYHDNAEARKWFRTDGIYTSSYDLISKVLQFDNDGDRSLVCVDPTLIAAAKRNCDNVVPLYYPMAKAKAVEITSTAIYDGMIAAYTGGNIGAISNQISRIWASENPDDDLVKMLCMLNNFVIDFAKTLYKPTIPREIAARMKAATSGKLPRFFMYAKDKTLTQVSNPSLCVVDRLVDKVQHYKFNFMKKELGLFDYHMLMHNKELVWDEKAEAVAEKYTEIARDMMRYDRSDADAVDDLYYATTMRAKEELRAFGTDQYVTDVIVKYLFGIKKATHKAMFWSLYGHIVYENLHANNAGEKQMCRRCGARFTPFAPKQCICAQCAEKTTSVPELPKVAVCLDCGKEFIPSNLNETRCVVCRWVLDNPVLSDEVSYCSSCGAGFDTPHGRGVKSKLCKRCRDNARRINARMRKRKQRANMFN